MTLVTLTELKEEANLPDRNIDLSDYSDAQLQSRIDWATTYIQRESHRVFIDTTYTQTDEDHTGSKIYLHPTPIQSIEAFTIDEVEVDEDDYTWNSSTGRVRLLTTPTGEYTYSITYIVSETNTDIISMARDICMDLTFLKIEGKTDDTPEVQSFKSGNSQISYSKPNPMTTIDNRIAGIEKNDIYVGMI